MIYVLTEKHGIAITLLKLDETEMQMYEESKYTLITNHTTGLFVSRGKCIIHEILNVNMNRNFYTCMHGMNYWRYMCIHGMNTEVYAYSSHRGMNTEDICVLTTKVCDWTESYSYTQNCA